MIDFIRSLTGIGFAALLVAIVTGVMIVLQVTIRKGVWSSYVVAFMASVVILLFTLR